MENQEPGQPQEAPPVAPEPMAAPPEAPTVEPQAAPVVTPAPPPDDIEARVAQLEQENLRLRGAQSAADKRAAQMQAAYDQAAYELQRQQAAQLQAQQAYDAQAVEGMDDEQRRLYEAQKAARAYYQQAQAYQQQAVTAQWRAHLDSEYNRHIREGIPQGVLDEAVKPYQASPNPEDVKSAMTLAANNYWRQEAMKAKGATPVAPPPAPGPQAQVPQPPQVTSHTQASQITTFEEDAMALAEETKKTGKSTVYELLKRRDEEFERQKR